MATKKFNFGPGVYTSETDLSEVVSAPDTSIGAFVGRFAKGPANRRITVTNNKEFLTNFGNPNSVSLGYAGYAALAYLDESNRAVVVRATSGTEAYANVAVTSAGVGAAGSLFEPATSTLLAVAGYEDGNRAESIYAYTQFSFSGELFVVGSTGPGIDGNDTAIQIVTSAASPADGFDWQYMFDTNPFTDLDPLWPKIFKINVIRKSPSIQGFNITSGAPVETFYVSREQILDNNGNSLYIEDVINGVSNYIHVKDNTAIASTVRPTVASAPVLALSGGIDNSTVPAADIQSAWSLFADKEKISVNVLVCTETGDKNSAAAPVQTYVGNLAYARRDSTAWIQTDSGVTATDPTAIATNANYNFTEPSFANLCAGWFLVNDPYNGRKIYLPDVIFAAALVPRNDVLGNVSTAPAGPNRGRINALGMNVNWSGSQISIFDNANINVAKLIPGRGIYQWGQKTAQRKATALTDINVRRLLNFVESGLGSFLINFLFEPNNPATRGRIKSGGDGFLNPLAAAGYFNDNDGDDGFLFVCDSTNNTPDVINNNSLVATVYIKPPRVTYYIELQTVVTKSGVQFNEIIRNA